MTAAHRRCPEARITGIESSAARADAVSTLRLAGDRPGKIESFWLDNALTGMTFTPEELAGLGDSVTAEEVTAMARRVQPDLGYVLLGKAAEDAVQ